MSTHTHGIFSTYDRKAQYFLPPFTAMSDADAIRTFTEAVVASDLPLSKYPADFDLVRLGNIDLIEGTIFPQVPTTLLINGLVALTDAHRERARYQAVLSPQAEPESSPSAT